MSSPISTLAGNLATIAGQYISSAYAKLQEEEIPCEKQCVTEKTDQAFKKCVDMCDALKISIENLRDS